MSRANPDPLLALFRAIAAGEPAAAARMLARAPGLARQPLAVGASRREAAEYFFPAIRHYAYAGDTALHIAAAAYDAETAGALIARGAEVRARNRRGAEPLHYATDGIPAAAWWNPDAQAALIALLIGAGADPNSADASGVAPLHRAVRTRCAAAVAVLLERGADPRRRNASGSTPLHLAVQDTGRGGAGSDAARQQQAEIIALLLRHGACPSDEGAGGKSVAQCATADWIRALLAAR
ncbi:MAG: ankyrin repeat domain-containing protein [Deltaproteobacteria bacterium]|nr:ankyrin repeat domain-containing protein [Deltaproteobacteria bacterium]